MIEKRLHLVTTPKPSMVRSGVIVGGVFAAASGLFAFSVHWGVREMAEPLHDLNISDANAPGELSRPALRSTETQSQPAHWENAYTSPCTTLFITFLFFESRKSNQPFSCK